MRQTVEFVYHADGLPVRELILHGSWDTEGEFSALWAHPGTPMEPAGDGSFRAQLSLSTESDEEFYWGVKDANEHWMLFEQFAIPFYPERDSLQEFRLGNRSWLGLHRSGQDGYRAAVWAPRATRGELLLQLGSGTVRVEMTRRGEFWELQCQQGWEAMLGRPYGFLFSTECGNKVLRADPYAKVRQGPQKGVSDLFLTAEGAYSHRYEEHPDGQHILRFEAVPVQGELLSQPPNLSFFRDGTKLRAKALKSLLRREAPALPEHEAWWSSVVQSDGSIPLKRHPKAEAYAVCVGSVEELLQLEYRIEDQLGNEYHDPWCNRLDGHHNWARLGLVTEFVERAEREKSLEGPEDLRLYELHVGSLLGSAENLRRSSFQDVEKVLPSLKKLGFNTIALMPTNSTEGWRDWGYLGTSTLAHHEAFAGPGLNAQESLLQFLERAHDLGLRVFTDVVYNHIGGFHNDLWEFDGLGNSWFEREQAPSLLQGELPKRPYNTVKCLPRTEPSDLRETPWGPIPAFNKAPVAQFYVDHAMDQVQRLGFDGIRFDFTHLIHSPGHGGSEGWDMLRALHLRLRYFYPQALTFAEEFPPSRSITASVEMGGAGFDGMWNTEHQHRLIFDHHRLSVTQALVEGQVPNLEHLLQHLTFPEGFSSPCSSATVLSNHDEVGNARRLYRIVEKHPRGLDIARLVSWFSLLCPGHPILFQGTEDLASNFFSWGLPHTWDVKSHLGDEELPKYRLQHLASIRDVLKLRAKSPDLWANSEIVEHHLQQNEQVLSVRRGRFWIVANFSEQARDLPSSITREARLVANSERASFGYLGSATRGSRIGSYALKVWEKLDSRFS